VKALPVPTTRAAVLSGVSSSPFGDSATEAASSASRGVTVLRRVCQRGSYRLFGSPVPLRCCLRSPLGSSGPRLPPSRSHVPGSSSHELPASYRDPPGCHPFSSAAASCNLGSWVPPMRFPAPSAHQHGESAYRPGSTRNTIPPRPFSDPRGVDPHRAPWPCSMPQTLMGFSLPRAFPHRGPPPGSSPEDTLSAFLRSLRRAPGRAPRAFHPAAVRSLRRGVSPALDPMPSRASSPSLRPLASRVGTDAQEAEPRDRRFIRS
jgi:hypothetical protein